MFKLIRGLAQSICFCAILWIAAHYAFASSFDRAHSKGSRIYRVNSYEQFIKQKTGDAPIVSVA
jgi:hypothetical protein